MLRSDLLPVALLVTVGCQDYLFEQKCPEVVKEQEISRAAAKPSPADILFVVDNSGSMGDEQDNLAANFTAFIDNIAGPDNDYRIAVVSTDLDSRGGEQAGRRMDITALEPGTGVEAYVGVDSRECTSANIDHGCFRGPSPQTRVIDSKVLDRDAQISTFVQNVAVGTCGSGNETGLAAMIAALENADGCNQGFLRPDANLVVILVSDEEDASPGPVGQYIEDLKRLKGIDRVRVAAIVGSVDGEATNCSATVGANCGSLCREPGPAPSTGRACTSATEAAVCEPHERCINSMCNSYPADAWDDVPGSCLWCSYFRADDCCSALAGNRYVEFARRVEAELNQIDPTFAIVGCSGAQPDPMENRKTACLIDSICQDSFAATLQRIAKDLVFNAEFQISPPALNPEGLGVRLRGGRWGDGIELVPGIDFDASATSVRLKGDKIPAENEEIDIYYVSEVIDSSASPRGACGI